MWTKIFQKFKCPWGGGGGMLKLRFDWYIILLSSAVVALRECCAVVLYLACACNIIN